jgi:hypothetical protein
MSFVRSENLHRRERFVGLHHSESDGYFGIVLSVGRADDRRWVSRSFDQMLLFGMDTLSGYITRRVMVTFSQRSNVYVLSGSRREDQLLLLHFE